MTGCTQIFILLTTPCLEVQISQRICYSTIVEHWTTTEENKAKYISCYQVRWELVWCSTARLWLPRWSNTTRYQTRRILTLVVWWNPSTRAIIEVAKVFSYSIWVGCLIIRQEKLEVMTTEIICEIRVAVSPLGKCGETTKIVNGEISCLTRSAG